MPIDHTYKLYYGGAQKRADGNYVRVIRDSAGSPFAEVPESNRKDVRNAVEAAAKVHTKAGSSSPSFLNFVITE